MIAYGWLSHKVHVKLYLHIYTMSLTSHPRKHQKSLTKVDANGVKLQTLEFDCIAHPDKTFHYKIYAFTAI